MKFQKNEYAIFAYTTNNNQVDIADGNIVDVDADSVIIDYDNVRGPASRMQIRLNQIVEIFDPVFASQNT